MKFELREYHRGVTKDELIADIKRVALKLNRGSVTEKEYGENGKYAFVTCIRKFGSWNNTLKKAGLDINLLRTISEEELFQNLEEIWIKLGRQPYGDEVQQPFSKYHVATYERRFGTWRKALETFVAFINNEERVSSEEAIKNTKIKPSTLHKTKRGVNWRLRFVVMKHDNFKCKSCGRSPATDPSIILHVDHKKAWANGGETVLENLQTLCSKCNIGKSDL